MRGRLISAAASAQRRPRTGVLRRLESVRTLLTSGKRSGCSIESTARSTSKSGQYKWSGESSSTFTNCAIGASRNHGNLSNGRKSSRSLSRSQRPCIDTFPTSTSEVRLPRGADFIFMLLDQPDRDGKPCLAQAEVLGDTDIGIEPYLCLSRFHGGHEYVPSVPPARRSRICILASERSWDSPDHPTASGTSAPSSYASSSLIDPARAIPISTSAKSRRGKKAFTRHASHDPR